MVKKTDEMKEIREAIKELIERQKKTDEELEKTIKELRAIKELRESKKKIDEEPEKTDKLIKELRESQKKTDELQKKTDEQIRKTSQNIGRLTDSWGEFVEGLVEPSIPELFGELGIDIFGTLQNARRRRDGKELEIDILATGKEVDGKNVVIAVEVKSTLGVREVKECIEDLENFFDFFDEYRGRELIGVVSGIKLTREVKRYAEKEGLYILGPSGENMVILNKKEFKPKIWR